MYAEDARLIGWGPSNVGLRVRRRDRLIRRRRDRGWIHEAFYDASFGPGVYVTLDSGAIIAVYTLQLNREWERAYPVAYWEHIPRR